MNSTQIDVGRLALENRQLIQALRSEIDVLRGIQTASNAALHAAFATHTQPQYCQQALSQMVEQLARQSAGWPEASRQVLDSTIASLRTTLDHNVKNREAHKAQAAG